jgi:hypothetical protein
MIPEFFDGFLEYVDGFFKDRWRFLKEDFCH